MTQTARWLDGNAVAGLLDAVFETEMTEAERTCASCGTLAAVGAHRAFLGAGVVLRCPACGDVALRVAVLPDRHVVRLTGTWLVEMPRR
jgi:predicted RNA-binding Zn-ribbon protein involved in translation (DUF1610 family)